MFLVIQIDPHFCNPKNIQNLPYQAILGDGCRGEYEFRMKRGKRSKPLYLLSWNT